MPSSAGGFGETIPLLVLFAVVLGIPLFGHRLVRRVARVVEDRKDRRAQRRPAPPRTGQLVDNLRRLSRLQAELPDGAPWARQHGTQLAYDSTLVELCGALGVTHELSTLPWGLTRDVERLRVEDVIYGLGLRIHTVGT